jgi:hypothetical protein
MGTGTDASSQVLGALERELEVAQERDGMQESVMAAGTCSVSRKKVYF